MSSEGFERRFLHHVAYDEILRGNDLIRCKNNTLIIDLQRW